MHTPTIAAILAASLAGPSMAQDAPDFFTATTPPPVLGPLLQTYGALNGEASELDTRTRELIASAVRIELVFTACLIAAPETCRERNVVFADNATPMICLTNAQVELAKWSESHPGWRVTRWKCRSVNHAATET